VTGGGAEVGAVVVELLVGVEGGTDEVLELDDEEVAVDEEVDAEVVEALAVVGSGAGSEIDTPPLCRGFKPRASSAARPYLMMSSSPGAAVGTGKAVTNGKSASAAAQGMGTFIGYGRRW
jgi:hypothetical protein